MNLLAQLISPELMRFIALSLLYFLWQGTALSTIDHAGMAMGRTAQSRYPRNGSLPETSWLSAR